MGLVDYWTLTLLFLLGLRCSENQKPSGHGGHLSEGVKSDVLRHIVTLRVTWGDKCPPVLLFERRRTAFALSVDAEGNKAHSHALYGVRRGAKLGWL